MSYPWIAQTAHNKAAVSEGLKIVRKVIARDAVKTGLSTKDLYKLAIREPPPPTFSLTIPSQDDESAPAVKYGRTGRRRILPPAPPHPRHPVRSLSFLKQHILPIIEGERYVRHVREKRLVLNAKTDTKSRLARGQKQAGVDAPAAAPVAATVWVWQASKPPLRVQKPVSTPAPVVYDCSHMKASKRKAHKLRLELAAKRAVLRARREKLRAEARRKREKPILETKRAESRARHEAAEKAGLAEKERRRKVWMEQNPTLVKALGKKQQAGAEVKLGAGPSRKLRAA